MASESRLLWIIFAVLVALIVVPLSMWRIGRGSAAGPRGGADRHRDGRGSGLSLRAAAGGAGRRSRDRGRAPHPPGRRLGNLARAGRTPRDRRRGRWSTPTGGDWPEDDRVLRVFWFTIEAAYLGGDLTVDNVEKLLGQRAYLAPEMGRGLLAKTVPGSAQRRPDQSRRRGHPGGGRHHPALRQGRGGREGRTPSRRSRRRPARDGERLTTPVSPPFAWRAAFPDPVSPVLGELFRLPGFEPQPATTLTVERHHPRRRAA